MTKRSFLSFFVAAFLLCIAVLIGIVPNTIRKTSHAATTDLSDTDYTNSDYLLLENGTPSTKTIQNFAEEVIQASPNDPLYELPEVLPRDFLETSLINAVRQYYGKEYGYYIVKEGDYFDVLLIDFEYLPLINDKNANEYMIEIKPIDR